MNITETSSKGLKYEFRVVVDKAEIERQVTAKLNEISKRVKIPGFRPGKIPMPLLKQRYGTSVMGEVLEKTVQDSSGKAVAEKGLRPAMRPKIDIKSFEENGDLEYTLALEVLPEIGTVKLTGIKLEKPVYIASDAEVDEAIATIAERYKSSEAVKTKRAAKLGDILTIDFKGSVGGESRPGMNGDDYELELGSHSFIDTFEDQLVGAKPGDHKTVTVTFPANYGAAELSGKEAVFEVDVKELKKSIPAGKPGQAEGSRSYPVAGGIRWLHKVEAEAGLARRFGCQAQLSRTRRYGGCGIRGHLEARRRGNEG
jgi:trigger factor